MSKWFMKVPESKNVTDWAANNSCRLLKTLEIGGQVFACGLGGGLKGGVPRCFLVENDFGSGMNNGLGRDDFLGVSSPIFDDKQKMPRYFAKW